MTEENARSTLRLIAVTTVLVGVILTTMTLLSLLGINGAIQSSTQGMQIQVSYPVGEMGFFAVLADLAIVAWGLAFYRMSPRLARRIVA